MARTYREIENEIITALERRNITLSSSKVAEWRVWTSVFAGVIFSFEQMIDLFRRTVEKHSNLVRAGTADWYGVMVRRFQFGHTLLCNRDTYEAYYEVDDDNAKVAKQVAVKDLDDYLLIKVAGHNDQGKIVPLSLEESKAIKSYVEFIKFVGTKVAIVSQSADVVRYNLVVYCLNEAEPSVVKQRVEKGLNVFKTSLDFDAKLYSGKLSIAMMNIEDVVTVKLVSLERKSYINEVFTDVGIVDTMDAGYFEYAEDSKLVIKRLNDMTDED